MTEITFTNPLDYSVENIVFPSYNAAQEAFAALDKHLDTVEKRETELLTELESIEAAKQGDTGKVSTLAGITRAAKATYATANPDQLKTELEMVKAFKLNEAVALFNAVITATRAVAAEAREYYIPYTEYLSLQTIDAHKEVVSYLRTTVEAFDYMYTDRIVRAGFNNTGFKAPDGNSVQKSLYNSTVPLFKEREVKERLQEHASGNWAIGVDSHY